MPAQKNRKRLPPTAPSTQAAEPAPAVQSMGGKELARHLSDPQRDATVVVVSHVPAQEFRLDTSALAARLGAEARVIEVVSGPETHQLQNGLPPRLHIFGTGARVYPHGDRWTDRVPRPHLAYRTEDQAKIYETLEHEVLAATHFEPVRTSTASLPVIAEAVVTGFPAEDRAMVELVRSGGQAVIRSGDLLPGIPLDWLVAKGQKLSGVLDPASHVLDVKDLLRPGQSPVTVYSHGNVALARVKSVSPRHATVQLWPGSDFRIGVEHISSNDLDSAEDLLTEGEVVRVRVLYEHGAVLLSMLDVDDDEPAVPAPALLLGGPPWLDYNRPYASIFTIGSTVPSPAPDGPDGVGETRPPGVEHAPKEALLTPAERRTALQCTQRELEAARRTVAELLAAAKRQGATDKVARALQDQLETERRSAEGLARMLNNAEHQLEVLRTELARTKTSLVQVRQQRRSATSRSENVPETLFLDPAEQFDFDLRLLWAQVVPAAEKGAHPLGSYSASPAFLESWSALTEQQRSKTMRAVVDLVADRQGPLRKREPHVLRLNDGAHAAPTMRGDDVCWRLYVEQGTAAALRLHYWKLPAGGYELHAVVPHDVVKP